MKNYKEITKKFISIFEDEQSKDSNKVWKQFFVSDIFLDHQFSDWLEELEDYLNNQTIVLQDHLPQAFLLQIMDAYNLATNGEGILINEGYLYGTFEEEKATKYELILKRIWDSQEHFFENHKKLENVTNVIRRNCFLYYLSLKQIVENQTYDKESFDFCAAISIGESGFVLEDDEIEKMDEDDIDDDDNIEAGIVDLYSYILRKYNAPIEVCRGLYQWLNLDELLTEKEHRLYDGLKEYILSKYSEEKIMEQDWSDWY